jgi:hypothetical protein
MSPARSSLRAGRWAAMALVCLGAWMVWGLRATPQEQIIKSFDQTLRLWREKKLPLERPEVRNRTLALFLQLADLEDDRRLSELSELIVQGPFTAAELEQVLPAAFRYLESWNDDLPSWKWDLLNKQASLGGEHLRGNYCELHDNRTKVRFQFRAGNHKHRKLYLEGNWNHAGRISALSGWAATPMSGPVDGVWSAHVDLQRSPFHHYYHAVVRTAPWPAGKAVGWARLRAGGNAAADVEIAETAEEHVAPTALTADADKRIGLAVIGIDAATWHLLLPLIHRGVLPNLERLVKEGAPARLISTGGRNGYPSNPNIHTALTGYLPFRHQSLPAVFQI